MGNWFTDTIETVGGAIADAARWVNKHDPLQGTPFAAGASGPSLFDVLSGDTPEPVEAGGDMGGPLAEAVTRGSERFFQGYEWAYDNGVSQPISTATLMLYRPEKIFSASEWARTWEAAEHISPGQAFQLPYAEEGAIGQFAPLAPLAAPLAAAGIIGDRGHVQSAVESDLIYYEPPAAALPPGWEDLPEEEQQRILREVGMPVDPRGGNAYIARLRENSLGFRMYSGVNDFALRWYADPFVIGGKGIRAYREATTVRRRPREGWSADDINRLVRDSRTEQLVRFLDENRGNPALINSTDFARNTIGPRLGAINELLTSPQEVRDFIRVGMGDVAAEERLRSANALVAARLDSGLTRIAQMDALYARYATRDPRIAARAERQRQRLQRAVDADEAIATRYEEILRTADQIDQLRISPRQYQAARNRAEAQRMYSTGPARGRGAARQFRADVTPTIRRADADPIRVQSGFHKTILWGVGDFFTSPVTFIRGIKNMRPNGYLELDNARALDQGNIDELRGQIARIPGLSAGERQNRLNQYLRLRSEGARKVWLDGLHKDAMVRIARKHGLDPKVGEAIFRESKRRRAGMIDDMRQYSASAGPDGVRVDAFIDGSGVKIHPHTVSRLVNSHVLDDLTEFDRVLRRNRSSLRALWEGGGDEALDRIVRGMDSLNSLWKFGTLLRLGYIPRVIGDELASQMARLGAAAMAMRAGYGVENVRTNLVHRSRRELDRTAAQTRDIGVTYAQRELAEIQPTIRRLDIHLRTQRHLRRNEIRIAQDRVARARARVENLPAGAQAKRRHAAQQLLLRREGELRQAQARATGSVSPGKQSELDRLLAQQVELRFNIGALEREAQHLRTRNQRVTQGTERVTVDGTIYPAAFQGQRGEYWMRRIDPGTAYDHLLKTNQQLIYNNVVRSFDHGARPISAIDDPVKHAEAWAHAINAQMAGDVLQRQIIAGMDEATAVQWLTRTQVGREYWRRLGIEKMRTPEEHAALLRIEVDDYLPLAEIRQQALTPEGVTPDFLKKALPDITMRPTVHMANLATDVAQQMGLKSMNRVMDLWYQVAVTMPTRRLSRHPLYNQLYEGHLAAIHKQRSGQGARPQTVEEVERVADTARRLAERDMKRLVFDIAHRSDVAAALRWISPFFSATAESFQRWGRVIADRPETLGYAAKFYNAPAYMGMMQDSNGNPIFADGTYIDPATRERKLAPKKDRWIIGRLPEWIVDSPVGQAIGAKKLDGALRKMPLSQNSMNIVTQGDPWYNPGVGPIVQIPVNEFVKDKPSQAELARHLGILPFGPNTAPNPVMRTLQSAAPSTIRNFLTAFDTSDYRYQQIKMQVMQRAIFDHEVGGKPMLTAEEIADRTRNYWLFRGVTSFVQPAATRQRDPYQFYRDQYRTLQRKNPETADMEFLNRFGEDYFIFAQSMSKHEAGVPSTKKAVELSQEYADLLAEFPELGSLIIGPEGEGPFSPEAYAYQLNTPLEPGGAEAQRRRLSAAEALEENQRRLGWAKYTARMNSINARLQQRGLTSLEDEGAEDLALERQAFIMMFAEPLIDGEENQFYNEAWSKDWYSFDARKYERLIPALDRVSQEMLRRDPERTDLQRLRTYLAGRDAIQQALGAREFTTLGAQANSDLREAWTAFVGGLVEADTTFGDLHSRYLARDLGIDISEEVAV